MTAHSSSRQNAAVAISGRRLDQIVDRLSQNKRVRRALPAWGRLHIDRPLPFLCLYRRPTGRDDPGTDRLCVAEAAYLLAPGDPTWHAQLQKLIRAIGELMVDRFGAFLILELWSCDAPKIPPRGSPPRPEFTLYRPPEHHILKTVDALCDGLHSVKTSKQRAELSVKTARRIGPPGLRPLFSVAQLEALGAQSLGLEVQPIYVNEKTGEVFPLLLRSLRRQLGHVLDRTFYEFAHECTTHQPPHYHALGRRATVKAVWEVDRRLAAVSNSFDFLYQVTPVNAEQAWRTFQRNRFNKAPTFLYRPRVIDPGRMKRALFDIHIERVEDPTLMHLFLGKQIELDRQLSMLNDLGRKAFLYGSLQLHGEVPPPLVETAGKLLARTPARSTADVQEGYLAAARFATLARREVARYQRRFPEFDARVRVTDDIYTGLLVSRRRLLIGKGTRIPARRADALIQHEVGTHLLTYFNGQAQPFKMLSSGLPGYEELQEGLAVLAEYLVGGLSTNRMRVLAARVVAAHALIQGASFVDVFRLLNRTHEFSQRPAYTITMRIFRGGGLVKDAVYLRGLVGILKHLGAGGEWEKLFIGKIATAHLPVIEELLHRRILIPPPVFPRYFEWEATQRRLAALRRGASVLDLITTRRRKAS